jgi:tight adherence protein B
MVALGAFAGVGLAAGAWLLVTSIWGTAVTARSQARRRRVWLAGVRSERVALVTAVGLVTLLVSRWPVAGLGAAVAAWWVPLPGQRAARQQAEARTAALAQWCASLRDAAGTARGIEGILTATAPAAPAPIRAEVGRMATRLEAQRLEVVLDRLADDLDHPIGDLVVTALRLAATAGSRRVRQVLGDLATAADLEASMRRRVGVARQRPRSTMQLVAVIVAAFVIGLIVFAGDYLAPYGTAVGQLVLAGVALYWAAGFWWMARLGRLPQAQRFLIRPRGAGR